MKRHLEFPVTEIRHFGAPATEENFCALEEWFYQANGKNQNSDLFNREAWGFGKGILVRYHRDHNNGDTTSAQYLYFVERFNAVIQYTGYWGWERGEGCSSRAWTANLKGMYFFHGTAVPCVKFLSEPRSSDFVPDSTMEVKWEVGETGFPIAEVERLQGVDSDIHCLRKLVKRWQNDRYMIETLEKFSKLQGARRIKEVKKEGSGDICDGRYNPDHAVERSMRDAFNRRPGGELFELLVSMPATPERELNGKKTVKLRVEKVGLGVKVGVGFRPGPWGGRSGAVEVNLSAVAQVFFSRLSPKMMGRYLEFEWGARKGFLFFVPEWTWEDHLPKIKEYFPTIVILGEEE